MRDGIHFWTFRDNDGLDSWDPDDEPGRFISGYGHAFLELYARLRNRGSSVSIGRTPPRGTRTVVASLEELSRWTPSLLPLPKLGLALAALKCRSVVVIRGDLPLEIEMPSFVSMEVMPTIGSVEHPGQQVHLPLLPQRGLVRRNDNRDDEVSVIALKAYSFNVDEWLSDPDFLDEIASLGFSLRIDTQLDTPNRWNDFAEVDVTLCLQPTPAHESDLSYRRKPATKLVNAWCAGTIPIVSRHTAYTEIIEPEVNALVGTDAKELLRALRRLKTDAALVKQLRAGAARASNRYSIANLCGRWETALLTAPRAPWYAATLAAATTGPRVVAERLSRTWKR